MAVDASDVNSGVSKFSKSWHLHFALDIFNFTTHESKITDNKAGETLTNFTATKGDLFLADLAYANKSGIFHCLNNDADFILRIRSDAFLMYSDSCERIDLLTVLKRAKANNAVDIPVVVDLSGGAAKRKNGARNISRSPAIKAGLFPTLSTNEYKRRSLWREISFFVFMLKSNLLPLTRIVNAFTEINTILLA